MKNEEVAAVFPLMKTFDNSADFYDLVLTEFVSTYLSTLKQADGTIAKLPEKIQDHPKYLEFKSFFQKIDDANMETMRIHDKL
ncbi:hypothetical protein FACS1894166_08210 [Bacilli bacterium]|nr:hypothetical protein FACS1894166_08210 [Bacilli bacterium]